MLAPPRAVAAAVLVLALGASAAACASSSSPASAGDGGTPAGQPRSFARDVVPILAQSCALVACHGDTTNPQVDVHFPIADVDALYMQLLADSPSALGAKLVVPGDATRSFLFAKVNGDQDNYSCAVPGCGETMPPGTKIPSDQRDTLRQWITEGAIR